MSVRGKSSSRMAAYRYNDADDDHDDFRNSGDNGVNGAANGGENSALR